MPHIVLKKINSTKEAFETVTPFSNKVAGLNNCLKIN